MLMEPYNPSKLFDRPGYITLSEYVADIQHMRKWGPWKLPLTLGDRIHFFVLSLVDRFSWYRRSLSVLHPYPFSPAYRALLKYLHQQGIFDTLEEKNMLYPGFYAYHMQKVVDIAGVRRKLSSQGISRNQSLALSKAIGEIVERSITGFFDQNEEIRKASYQEMLNKCDMLYPPRFHRMLEVQKQHYSQLKIDKNEVIPWVKGINLISHTPVFIPQQLTSYARTNLQSKFILQQPSSNGSAGFFTKEGALMRGILEVVHRDALMVHWLTTLAPQVIQLTTLPEHFQQFLKMSESFGIKLYVLNVTALPIPSIVVVAMSEQSNQPGVVMSAAAATTFYQAIENALEEIVNLVGHLGEKIPIQEDSNDAFISTLGRISRMGYWRGKQRVDEFRWFLSGTEVRYQDLCSQDLGKQDDHDTKKLQQCLEVLMREGADFFPVAYFPQHVVQKKLNFTVVQIFIPKAFPLYLTEYLGTFESERLLEFARSKGKSDWKLNPLPHVFA